MAVLETIWVGMVTHSGTDSRIVLIINERGGDPDLLHHTFPDTKQEDQEKNQANVYQITKKEIKEEGQLFGVDQLNESSIRVGIRGEDKWIPDTFFVWGEQDDGVIMPLALSLDLPSSSNPIVLSTDASEGKTSAALRRVRLGNDDLNLHRVLLLLITADQEDAGTSDKIELQIFTKNGILVVNHIIPNTRQDDLKRAQANLYVVPVVRKFTAGFSKNELNDDSIFLRITGDEAWRPASLFLFGVSDNRNPPRAVVPLVHLPVWPFGALSSNIDEGEQVMKLPLLPPGPFP